MGLNNLWVARPGRTPASGDYAPAAYNLRGAEAGTVLHAGHQAFDLSLTASNLFNREYRDYLNRFRYYTADVGQNIQLRVRVLFKGLTLTIIIFSTSQSPLFMSAFPQFDRSARLVAGAALLASLDLAGCNKNEEVVSPSVANEAITTMTLTVTNTANASDTQTATWEQLLDAKGNPVASGPDYSKATLILKANSTYTVAVGLLDKTQTPTLNVGAEIKDRANIHSFFFQPMPTSQALVIPAPTGTDTYPLPIPTPTPTSNPLNLTVTRTDQDTNKTPLPVGLTDQFATGAASTGYLRVVLRHQPNVKDGSYAPGSTDFDAGFQVTIQ